MAYEIGAIRTVLSDDETHAHVELAGYLSQHMPGEPIMVPIPRIIQKMALGESFVVKTDDGEAEVKPGKCEVCGHEPYLVAEGSGPNPLLALPRK